MSIFNNVRTPIHNPELNLYIQLKYGEPSHDYSWLEKLPESVLRAAFKKSGNVSHSRDPTDHITQVLSIMLRQPINIPKASKAIKEALLEYHTLLG